jgi:hypothetical protein
LGKTFAVLGAVQLVLLGFIAIRLTGLEQAVENTALNGPQVAGPATATAAREPQDATTPEPHDWESTLRRVIREEIESVDQIDRIELTSAGQVAGTGPSSPPHDPTRVAAVNSRLDYFISMGRISPAEMAKLQQDIARLDDGARKQMLGKLVRALNTGSLKGQL